MSDEVVARRYRVHGVVQGVGYRAFVWRLAGALGLSGWVRNRHDGSVEAVLRGTSAVLDQAVEQLRSGPRWSRVERIEVSDECCTDDGAGHGFEIRSTV